MMDEPAKDSAAESTEDDALTRAMKRVKALRDFYGHLVLYVVVMGILLAVDYADGSEGETWLGLDWAYFPLIGWGVFVVGHAVSVMFDLRVGGRWEQRKLQKYLDQERRREQPQH